MNIIITGASRGIGYELVRILAKDPDNNIFIISRNFEKLKDLKDICLKENADARIHPYSFDLLGDDYNILVPDILSKMGGIDILINNAGLLINKPFQEFEGEDFDLIFGANVKSAFLLSKKLYKHFNNPAHIVNIGSMGGYQGSVKFPGLSLYSASKAALAVMTECMAEEFSEKCISVNCLALGSAQTEMLEQAFPGYKAPLTAFEMAEFIGEFALKGHKFINGKIIPVSLKTP